ncbi:tail fiber protein [Serratia fonticola]|nr:tail fiber protein [Serratia fonticola]
MRLQGLGDQVAEIYLLEQVGDRTVLGFHIAGGGNEQWIELHATGEFTVNGSDIAPVGIPQPWPQENPPPGWLICNGAGFNTSLFPLLLKAYPNGVLPDLRGVFLRGKDNGRGIDPNRNLGELQWGQAPASAIGGRGWGDYAGRNTGHTSESGSDNSYNYAVLQETEQQRETRPVNISVNYIVRAA